MRLCRNIQTSSTQYSKISKRRKDTKLKLSPNLEKNAKKQGKMLATQKALNQFDIHYKQVFGSEWHSMRLAMLSKKKFAALVNNFSDKMATIDELEALGCLNMQDIYKQELGKYEDEEVMVENTDLSKLDLRRVHEENHNVENDTFKNENLERSMTMEEAKSRIIDPENLVIGGKTSLSMYDYVASDDMIGNDEFLEQKDYYQKQTRNMPFNIIKEGIYEFPTHLNVFIHPDGVFEHFDPPRRSSGGILRNYYCMDAASIIPVLMLDLKPADHMLDLCAGPGGKSLVAMQTLRPARIVCNEMDYKRYMKIKNVMESYVLHAFDKKLLKSVNLPKIQYTKRDGLSYPEEYSDEFDCVLCDVPCFTDRHVLFEEEGNLFNDHRIKERLRMPDLQSHLLISAIQCTKPGGTIVYSTCTLDPVQNDGVIGMSLQKIWENSKLDVTICDLSKTIQPFKPMMKFAENTRFGQLIMPCIAQNFGPMYVAKLKRIA